jgi:drug/metabolite transporter (DMT)-like permease
MPLSLVDAVAGLVERDRRSIRWYAVWAGVVVLVGLMVFFGSQVLQSLSAAHLDAIIKLGGSFIASLAVFPLKEVRERRQRIETLQWLMKQYEQQEDERAWFETVIRDRLRKEAGA